MRECFSSYCDKGKETKWVDDGTEDGYTITTDIACLTCEGTGEVGDECFCYARSLMNVYVARGMMFMMNGIFMKIMR